MFLIVGPRRQITLVDGVTQKWLRLCPEGVRRTPCYRVMRLELADGRPFCGVRCPLRARLGAGFPSAEFHALRRAGGGGESEYCLSGVALRPPTGQRLAVLHRIVPAASCPAAHDGRTPWAAIAPVERPGSDLQPGVGNGRLTGREEEVLALVAAGLSTAEVACNLGISRNTVRRHVQNSMRKLEVHRRLTAVLRWIKLSQGASRPPPPASTES